MTDRRRTRNANSIHTSTFASLWGSLLVLRLRSEMGIIIIINFTALLLLLSYPLLSQSKCNLVCDLALASYYLTADSNLTAISDLFGKTTAEVLQYNRNSPTVLNEDQYASYVRVNIPFSCDYCFPDPDSGPFLAHTFTYITQKSDRYDTIATSNFSNLTSEHWLEKVNVYPANNIPDSVPINVTVNCSCGDARVSTDYGLFVTYPLRGGENLSSVAQAAGVSSPLLQSYNPGVDFAAGSGLVFVPAKDQTGTFPPLTLREQPGRGKSAGFIAGVAVASVAALLLVAFGIWLGLHKRKKPADSGKSSGKTIAVHDNAPTEGAGMNSNRLVEFQFEELAEATNNFLYNKIGEGGFGSVYYAELRGEKAAIKKMHTQQPKEFLAELKVLGNVNHINLVRLIGYCIEHSLFLVYEFVENGNLSQHLRDKGRKPLPWHTRLQIALDTARGLEYLHEHTYPIYIHRDIKPDNILLDKDNRAKIADFGLTKIKDQTGTMRTEIAKGTRGYMPPEYLELGSVSPKVDVYSFGVVLYGLITGKTAITEIEVGHSTEWKTLPSLFEEALSMPDPSQSIQQLVDRRLGDDYSKDAVLKVALLARACTRKKPEQRPSMRSTVVSLSMLSTGDCNIELFIKDQAPRDISSWS